MCCFVFWLLLQILIRRIPGLFLQTVQQINLRFLSSNCPRETVRCLFCFCRTICHLPLVPQHCYHSLPSSVLLTLCTHTEYPVLSMLRKVGPGNLDILASFLLTNQGHESTPFPQSTVYCHICLCVFTIMPPCFLQPVSSSVLSWLEKGKWRPPD